MIKEVMFLNKKKISLGFISLCLLTAFSLSTATIKATDFEGKEEKYIKLCSSSKLTNSQQKTCKEFNTYLNNKNKELKKESNETKKDVQETKETIESLEKEISKLTKKVEEAKKELNYVNNNIKSLNEKITTKKALLEERLYSMQTSMNSNIMISYLYNAESLTDLFRRIINLHEITSYENELIAELNDSLAEVEKQKSTLALLKESLEKNQAKQEESKKKYFALLEKQNQEIASHNSEISKNQESMEDIQKNLAAIQKASDESKVSNVTQATPNKKPSSENSNNSNSNNSNNSSNTNSNNSSNTDSNNSSNNTNNSSNNNNSNTSTSSSEELGLKIANKALTRVGYMYVWGGSHSMSAIKNPNQTQFDCSGLVNWSHYQCGVNIGVQYTKSLLSCGKKVTKSQLQPGDIILFSSNGSSSGVHHVGIYIGNNQMVHAPSTGKAIQVANLSYSYWQKEWYTCRRLY